MAPREGFVFRRGAGGGAEASLSFSHSSSMQATLLRHWLRYTCDVTETVSGSDFSSRARMVGEH